MYDDDYCMQRYRALQRQNPGLCDNPADCPIAILSDPAEIDACRRAVEAERRGAGIAVPDTRVGVLGEDYYIGHIVRDAVRFSDGRFGLYNRVVATGGVTVLPILADGGIALIRIFRHPVRRWFLEAPQGMLTAGVDPAEETRRELLEEMEAQATEIIALGDLYTSTGMTSEMLKMFAARIERTGSPQRSEGIDAIRVIAKDEIDTLLRDGTICDGATTALITHARLRGLL